MPRTIAPVTNETATAIRAWLSSLVNSDSDTRPRIDSCRVIRFAGREFTEHVAAVVARVEWEAKEAVLAKQALNVFRSVEARRESARKRLKAESV